MNIRADVAISPARAFFGELWPVGIAVAAVVIAAIWIITRIRKKRRDGQNKGQ